MKDNKKDYRIYLQEGSLYNKKISSLKIAEEKVAWLLRKYPPLRDDDKLLIFYYWKFVDKFDGLLDNVIIQSLTSSATICRVRRRIQNTYGLFLPTNEAVIEARRISEKAVRDWARSKFS